MLDCQAEKPGGVHAQSAPRPQRERTRIIGCREQMELVRVQDSTKTGPDPWLVRKAAVAIVWGVYFYSYYVFVVRVCVKMVTLSNDRLGNRTQGVIYLAVYHVLFCMFIWTYMMAITTSPGFARDYVPKSEPPVEEEELVQVQGYRFENLSRAGDPSGQQDPTAAVARGQSDEGPQPTPIQRRHSASRTREVTEDDLAEKHATAAALGPVYAAAKAVSAADAGKSANDPLEANINGEEEVAITLPPKSRQSDEQGSARQRVSHDSATPSYLIFPEPPEDYEPSKPKLLADRIPARIPILTEKYRYDSREGFLRPYRSHRCKHCATVVLKMDHHCPWVGTCVGARNYKYFYNFLQWSFLYTIFVMMTLIIANTLRTTQRPYPGVDAQQMVIIGFAGLFAIFTGSLFIAHTRLIVLNMTTIEDMALSRVKARERSALTRVHGFWNLRAQHRTKQEWNREWGRLGREGNIWWLGSARANWEMVMGHEKLGWLLPIPARPTPDDGLSYKPNPRFSKEGYWLPRRDWPKELQ